MSGISAWIMSVAGISVLSVLVDLIMPNGQTKKYIKGIFAFVIILVIISPLPSLINKRFSIDDIFQEEISIQNEYIYEINRKKIEKIEKDILKDLENEGVRNLELNINANIFTYDLQIDTIFVDLSQVVINENLQHININELIKSSILKFVLIDCEKIIFGVNS